MLYKAERGGTTTLGTSRCFTSTLGRELVLLRKLIHQIIGGNVDNLH